MLQSRFKTVLRRGALAAAASFVVAGSAQAAVYQGTWDPSYGNIFPNLGWSAIGTFEVPEDCLSQADGTYGPTGACGDFSVLSMNVSFYDVANSAATLGTFTLNPSVIINGIDITDNKFTGLGTGFFQSFVPTGPAAAIAGNGSYAFSLILLGGKQAQLIYASPTSASPGCASFPVPNTSCGVSDNPAIAVFAPIPEPGTYALMLAGLGVMGFMARRRRS